MAQQAEPRINLQNYTLFFDCKKKKLCFASSGVLIYPVLLHRFPVYNIISPISLLLMMKRVCHIIAILALLCGFEHSCEAQDMVVPEQQDISMFDVLWWDYFRSPDHRKEKRQCFARYAVYTVQAAFSTVSAPVVYVGYYLSRNRITRKLQDYYVQHGLDDIQNVGDDIIHGLVDPADLRRHMGNRDYSLWLYGDTKDPLVTGGVPDDYIPDHSMFVRRWMYSGVRNPRWNATYIYYYTSRIDSVVTVYDDRSTTVTHNYGTSDTRLGTWLRWYIDEDGRWWYFYETTRRKDENKGKLLYFGAVRLGNEKDGYCGKYRQGRFELSLNRMVTVD